MSDDEEVDWNDKAFVFKEVKLDGFLLESASKELQKDRDIVLAAVTSNGGALRYASKELQEDRDIVLAAVTDDGDALRYASKKWRADRHVVLAAVTFHGGALQYASDKWQADRDIVLAAVTSNGRALEYASEEWQGNRDVVVAAVTCYGLALRYASEELQEDKEIKRLAAMEDIRRITSEKEKLAHTLLPDSGYVEDTFGLKMSEDNKEQAKVMTDEEVAPVAADAADAPPAQAVATVTPVAPVEIKTCYSYIASGPTQDGKHIRYAFVLGISVFVFQVYGLSLMLTSKMSFKFGENEDVDNPDHSFFPASESVLVIMSRFFAAIAFILCYDESLADVVQSVDFLLSYFLDKDNTKPWYKRRLLYKKTLVIQVPYTFVSTSL